MNQQSVDAPIVTKSSTCDFEWHISTYGGEQRLALRVLHASIWQLTGSDMNTVDVWRPVGNLSVRPELVRSSCDLPPNPGQYTADLTLHAYRGPKQQ